jgi:hypothetical protein
MYGHLPCIRDWHLVPEQISLGSFPQKAADHSGAEDRAI